jgi:hypothetical protein
MLHRFPQVTPAIRWHMNILAIDSGEREHALAWKMAVSLFPKRPLI